MFITHLRHNRNAVGVRHGLDMVDDEGLGIVVTMTTKFDPTRIRDRFVYWLELIADEMAKQARVQIEEAGFEVNEGGGHIYVDGKQIEKGEREKYREVAIKAMPFNEMSTRIRSAIANWSSGVAMPKGPTAFKTYGKMAMMAVISYALPWVGLSMMVFSMFGKKKKPRMAMPWNSIYAQALSPAQETTVNEEISRIMEEGVRIKEERVKAVEKISQEGAVFKLPEGVVGIKRGALVMALKGPSVEVRK